MKISFVSSLRGQFLFICLILISIVSVQVFIAAYGFHKQTRAIDNISAMGITQSNKIRFVREELVKANMDLYKFTNKLFAGKKAEELKDEIALFEKGLGNAIDLVNAINDEETATALAELKENVKKYKITVSDALPIITSDVSVGAMMLQATDDQYLKIVGLSEKILAKSEENTQSIIKQAQEDSSKSLSWLILFALGALIASTSVAVFVFRSISSSSRACLRITELVTEGNVNINKEIAVPQNEFGLIIEQMHTMVASLNDKIRVAVAIAKRDLSQESTVTTASDTLGSAVNSMGAVLRSVFNDISLAFANVSNGATELMKSSDSLAHGATVQGAALEETTQSLGEISKELAKSLGHSHAACEVAFKAKGATDVGYTKMQKLTQALNELRGISIEISKIVKTIDDIAFQTNLLALNAAVEAARAGKHGKGFAVVSEEVRTLARRSSLASAETATLIAKVRNGIENGVLLGNEAMEGYKEIHGLTENMALGMESLNKASQQQAILVDAAAKAMNRIEEVNEQNSASAQQTAAAAHELQAQSTETKALIATFKF